MITHFHTNSSFNTSSLFIRHSITPIFIFLFLFLLFFLLLLFLFLLLCLFFRVGFLTY